MDLINMASRFWKATGIVLTVLCGIGLILIFIGLVNTTLTG